MKLLIYILVYTFNIHYLVVLLFEENNGRATTALKAVSPVIVK